MRTRRWAAWGTAAGALGGATVGCNLIIGLQSGIPEGPGGGSTGSGTGEVTSSSVASSSGVACTMDAGTYTNCDRSWAHWSYKKPRGFKDNGDGTVTDLATGLLWQKSFGTMTTQSDATTYCHQLALAGHCDWRLPTRIELSTLVDYTKAPPAAFIDPAFEADTNGFWTSSPVVGSMGAKAWVVHFESGLVDSSTNILVSIDVRCVR